MRKELVYVLLKLFKWSLFIFLAYVLFIILYLYFWAAAGVPEEFAGTVVDPKTFMDERQLELTYEYSKIRNLLFFIRTPLEWLILFWLLIFGLSTKMEKFAAQISQRSLIQYAVYIFIFSVIMTIVMFPLRWFSYTVSKSYGLTTSTVTTWMRDNILDFWIDSFTLFLIASLIYLLMKRFQKKWWLFAWIITVPFVFFAIFLQPVVIDPLYNDFYPLQNKELEARILALASEAAIPSEHVYEVNMSEKTNTLNAYVTGIGSNSRIVLWDTTLERLSEDGVLFIMAHEMAHYVKKHVYIGVSGYLLLSLLGFYITAKIVEKIYIRWGKQLRIQYLAQISSFPLIALVFSMFLFFASPFANAVSRYQESSADQYALELTNNPEAAIETFQELTVAGLSEVHPPALVKLFRYGHPTMFERMLYIEKFANGK